MEQSSQETGRVNQKRRTRAAIVAAAVELLRQNLTPTVAEVADTAAVSRATAYRYFPSQEYLLSEAALHSIVEDVGQVLEATTPSSVPETRLDVMIQAVQERTINREGGFRALLRLSLEQPFDGDDAQDPSGPKRRGGRRIDWIEQALEPVWDGIDELTKERLVGALSLCMGIESIVVLRDICEFSPRQAIEVSRWTAQAIVRAGLADTRAGHSA